MPFEQRHGKAWQIMDGTASEREMGEFLFGLVRMLKPDLIVETGTYQGFSAAYMNGALVENNRGRLISCDIEQHIEVALLSDHHLSGFTELRICSSLDLPELSQADLVYSDSDYHIRAQEYSRIKPGCVFVIHDTDEPYDGIQPPILGQFVRDLGGLTFDAGRGFGILIKPKK